MNIRLLGCTVALIAVMAQPASAGIWAWGCTGQLGKERVIFDRYTMIVTDSNKPQVKLQDLASSSSKLETEDGATFNSLDGNGGLEKTIRFEKNDEPGRKLTLTETSSRRTFTRAGHVGKREETTTKFLKTFRYALDKEPERTIKMQCIEYVLTTCGGPCS
jgi:hypothetical protein